MSARDGVAAGDGQAVVDGIAADGWITVWGGRAVADELAAEYW